MHITISRITAQGQIHLGTCFMDFLYKKFYV